MGAGESRDRIRTDFSGRDFDAVAEAQHALPGARACRHLALDRGAEQLRQQRVVLEQPVRFVSEAAPFDEPGDPANHAAQGSLQFFAGWRGGGVES